MIESIGVDKNIKEQMANMTISKVKIEEVQFNKENPRIIRDDKFKQLVKSIKSFPEMLNIRPIVVDEDNIVLGGNMRLKACKEAGLTEVPIIKASELSEDQKKEFVLKDNQSYGEWDTKLLSTWSKDLLLDSGFEQWDMIDIFGINDMENNYKKEIEGSNFNDEVVDVKDQIANMRIKGAATKTMLDFLQNEIGYKQAESYEIVREAQQKIQEMYRDLNNTAFEEAVARLERLSESSSDKKLKLEIEKELNKLKGLYKPQKLDVTTDGKSITDITITIVDGPQAD